MTNKATSADQVAEKIINLIIKPSIHPIKGFEEGAAGFLIAKELGSYAEEARNAAIEECARVAENFPGSRTPGVYIAIEIRQLKAGAK